MVCNRFYLHSPFGVVRHKADHAIALQNEVDFSSPNVGHVQVMIICPLKLEFRGILIRNAVGDHGMHVVVGMFLPVGMTGMAEQHASRNGVVPQVTGI